MAKGHDITVLEPIIYFSPNYGTQQLPKRGLPYGAAWPTGWIRIPYTANGAQWTFVNPKQDIGTDEVGVLKSIAAGTHTINVTFQARTPVIELIKKIASLRTTAYTTRAEKVSATFATGATGSGSLVVTLPDGASATIGVTSGAQSTPALVATAVAAGTFTGWTTTANPAGSPTGTVTFTQSTPAFTSGYPTITVASTGVTLALGSPSIVQDGYIAHERMVLDPSFENHFLIGMDGHYKKDGLRDVGGRMRAIAYAVEQTDNPQVHFRKLGNDALLQPTMTARCVTSVLDPTTQLAGSGLTVAETDDDGRFDLWDFPDGP